MSFWSVEVKRGIPEYYSCIPGDGKTGLRLTQATLGKGSSKDKSYVECYVDGSKIPICICSLIPNKTETQILDLIFSNKQDVKFSVVGPRSVFLLGHYLYDRSSSRQTDDSEPPGFNIEYSDESSEDSMRKKREKEENKYDVNDSFIDDKSISDDTFFGRLRPLSGKKEKVLKKKTNKKKKKGYVVSESEDDGERIQLYI